MMVAVLLVTSFSLVTFSPRAVEAQGDFTVTIIVADDFSGQDLSSVDPTQFGTDDNCAVSLEGQAYAVRGVSADPITAPHGDLVVAELEELIEDAGASSYLNLVEVDIHGIATDEAADAIAAAINANPADFHVVNMSFSIIPCDMLEAFAEFGSLLLDARDAKDLNRYRGVFQRAVVFYDNQVFPAMSNKAQQADDLDPLQSLFASLGTGVIPVAAAGNFGLDFPFWPGAWGQVVSVSASEGESYYASSAWDKKNDTPLLDAEGDNPGQTKRVSNYGEVMVPGEYDSDFGMISGTSFAAPRLSVAMALYVSAVGDSYCRTPEGAPALASGDWDNLTLDQAVQDHCPGMQPYLP
jgi:hypothetical protein